jgi:hypothetical protein
MEDSFLSDWRESRRATRALHLLVIEKRAEFTEALLAAKKFEDLPGKYQILMNSIDMDSYWGYSDDGLYL